MHPTPHPVTVDHALVEWGMDNVARSPRYGDVFHSTAGALGQTLHVFVEGNRLHDRWSRPGWLAIGELGFGSGLNFLVTAARWLVDAHPDAYLAYCALEKHPWRVEDATRLYAQVVASPAFSEQNTAFQSALESIRDEWLLQSSTVTVGCNRFVLCGGRIHLTLHVDDIRAVLPEMRGRVDAWYLDGFNPRSNQAMWTREVRTQLARLSRPGCTLATWCCSGEVRRGLEGAGFHVNKAPGYAHKREMLVGSFPSGSQRATPSRVEIIGAGLAGCWMADALAGRGVQAVLLDQRSGPGRAASAMPMMMVRPFARHRDTPTARFFWQAAHYAVHRLSGLRLESWKAQSIWRQHGNEPPGWLSPAGTVDGADLCDRILQNARIETRWSQHVPFVEGAACRTNLRIFCSGSVPSPVTGTSVKLRAIRGQQSLWQGAPEMLGQHAPRVGDCVANETDEGVFFGATYRFDDENEEVIAKEALDYGARLPFPPELKDLEAMRHWAGTRWQSRDRLPLCGPAADESAAAAVAEVGRAEPTQLPGKVRVWLNVAHGSRGATSSPLTAALLADRLLDLPEPILASESAALDPRRFWLRDWRRGKWSAPVSSDITF